MIALSIINPIDLGRILFLIKFNIAALMGYTGAVFRKFFGTNAGMFISMSILVLWVLVPVFRMKLKLKSKDF